jgi:hypothetical protein
MGKKNGCGRRYTLASGHEPYRFKFEFQPISRVGSPTMAKKLDDIMAALPKERRQRIHTRAMELATLKDLPKQHCKPGST